MNILAITNLYPNSFDPNRASFNRQQFERLSDTHDMTVVIPISWLDFIRSKRDKTYSSVLPCKLIPYFYIPGMFRSFNALFMFFSLLIFLFPYRLIFKSDVFLLSWAYPDAVAGTMLAKLFNKRTVCKIHGSDINMFAEDKFKRRLIVWAMKHASHVLSVSKALKNKLVGYGVSENKISVVYNGVNHDLFNIKDKAASRKSVGVDPNDNIILYVGNLKYAKGCIDLAEAYKSSQTENSQLIYIGTGECSSQLKDYSQNLTEGKRIQLVGAVKHDVLNSWFNAADVVCLPSHNEGVPNILLEAFSSGVPSVATNVGGIPEIFCDDCGKLVSLGDKNELTTAIDSVLMSNNNRKKISQHSEKFNWGNNIETVNKILGDII